MVWAARTLAIVAALLAAGCAVAQPDLVSLPVSTGASCRTVESVDPAEVTWLAPDVPRDRRRLDDWCRTVGPLVMQPAHDAHLASARPVEESEASDLLLITWNTHLGRGDLEGLVQQIRRGQGTPAGLVLLLQEVYRGEVLDAARILGLHAVFAPAFRKNDDPDDRGNAILSTSAIGNLTVVELPFEKQRRVALAAAIWTIGADGVPWRLHVVNLHFTTGVALTRGGPAAARRRQARGVMQAVRSLAPPIVVAGDLNTWWGDDEPAVAELRRAFPDAEPVNVRETWRGPLGLVSKLDYLFARLPSGRLAVERVPDRFGSDHYPLLTIVRPTGSRFLGTAAPTRHLRIEPTRARE
jgi:endonuclease/exonuclease/phosphatase family metal-dependent hydrolase